MKEIKDRILKEYKKGNIIVAGIEGLQIMLLNDFIKQPVDGMLYDLNRGEAVILTFIDDPKWINDYAVCQVIRALKKRIEELEKQVEENNCIIAGCYDCPVCDRNDMCAGYSCRLLSSPDSFIKENKKYQPITPKWCPIKKQPLIIQYDRRI